MKAVLGALLLAVVVMGVLLFIGRSKHPPEVTISPIEMIERVELKTSDSVLIVGDYYKPIESSARGILLLHMMPATRASWRAFAERMQSAGYHVLAIDLRGHGESQGGPDGYRRFSDVEHQATRFDAEAGAKLLEEKGVTVFALGGASIGANLALQYLAEHPQTRAAFLLSPGLDYRGVKTEPAVRALHVGQAVYYVASEDDQYSADTIRTLSEATPSGIAKDFKLFPAAGHGTTIFEREPAFIDDASAWFQQSLEGR